jgi:hypothetical protein
VRRCSIAVMAELKFLSNCSAKIVFCTSFNNSCARNLLFARALCYEISEF